MVGQTGRGEQLRNDIKVDPGPSHRTWRPAMKCLIWACANECSSLHLTLAVFPLTARNAMALRAMSESDTVAVQLLTGQCTGLCFFDDRDCVRGSKQGAAIVPGVWISCGAIGWQFLAVRTRGGRGSISLGELLHMPHDTEPKLYWRKSKSGLA